MLHEPLDVVGDTARLFVGELVVVPVQINLVVLQTDQHHFVVVLGGADRYDFLWAFF